MGQRIVDKQSFLPVLTFIILVVLIVMQVSLIFRAAKLEEQNFNHRVAMALKGARDEIGARVPLCSDMSDFLCGRKCAEPVHTKKYKEVDSIIQSNLSIYNIDLPYTFEVTDSILHLSKGRFFSSASYLQNLNGLIDQNGVQIKLLFPTRNQFIIGQIRSQLGLSILFIIFVMYSFLVTYRMFKREKALLLRTTDFINNMVHEFQTPIANVRFATNLLKKISGGKEHQKKTDEYSGVILEETQRLQNHVEAILKVACPNGGDLEPEAIDFNELVEAVIATFRYRLEHTGAIIHFSPSQPSVIVNGERGPLTLAVSNLIDNALKYVCKTPEIFISTKIAHNMMVLKVRDNGIGIRKEDQELIFDRFFRVSTGDVHNVKGFGLGLTYVKKVTLQHNGTISVESVPEKGSTFTIKIPIAHDASQTKLHSRN